MRTVLFIRRLQWFVLLLVPALIQAGTVRFQEWGVEQGLSQGTVTSIVQDYLGFVWIGTLDGLNRFDGLGFTTYHHDASNPASLTSSAVISLYQDSDSTLWIGTSKGLVRYDRARDQFIRYHVAADDQSPVSPLYVSGIVEGSIGKEKRIWISAMGLYFVDRSSEKLVEYKTEASRQEKFKDLSFLRLQVDHDGSLWTMDYLGFFRLNPGSGGIDHVCRPGYSVHSLLPGPKECWIGSDAGILRYDLVSGQVRVIHPVPTFSIVRHSDGKLWAGTANGLARIEQGDDGSVILEYFNQEDDSRVGLTSIQSRVLSEDAAGALWIGTFDGLKRLDPYVPQFTVYKREPQNPKSLGNTFVMPIVEALDGALWFGTLEDGIWVLEDNGSGFVNYKNSSSAQSLCGNNVRSALRDRTGLIWIGTDRGLSIYDPAAKRFQCHRMQFTDDRPSRWVEALYESSDGTIWMGITGVGLVPFDRRRGGLEMLDYPERLPEVPLRSDSTETVPQTIRTIHQDRFNNLWVGTELGLIRLHAGTKEVTLYSTDPDDSTSISNDEVWSILEDSSADGHILWIGTGNGLNRFDAHSGVFRRYLKQEGFPNTFVYAILRDDAGRLWMSTNHGICRFDDRQPEGRKFKNYDATDGLPGNEFNRNSFCRLRSGEFLFGGTRGVVRFDPLRMRDNPFKPPVVLTSFQKFGKPVRFDRPLHELSVINLTHDENAFSFEFVALNFSHAEKNRYQYRLEGFDQDWVQAGTRRYANFTHLDPGEYTFRVRGSNNDGVWSDKEAVIGLIILPPFWQTWWFISVVAILFLSAGPIIYYRKVAQLNREQQAQREFSKRLIESQESERKRIARELHDGIGQNLLVMKNNAATIKIHETPDAEVAERLHDIAGAASDALGEIREITANLRPFMLDKFGLDEAIRSLVDRTAQSSAIEFSTDIGDLSGCLLKEQEINFYRIVQESMNNILKHSKATRVSISIQRSDNRFVARIEDNGKGFRPEAGAVSVAGHGGFGLQSMAERMKLLDGTMRVESAPDAGTRMLFEIPIRPQST